MSPSPSELLVDGSAQSPDERQNSWNVTLLLTTDEWRRFLNCSWTFRSRVMRSRHKVYRNRLQEGDLKASLCGFGGVKCQCVCFFAWNLELILSSSESRSSDSVLPNCLLLLHCQVKWCKSTQIAVKTNTTTRGNNIYTLLITFIAVSSFILSKFRTFYFPYKFSYYAWATCRRTSNKTSHAGVFKMPCVNIKRFYR